MTDTVSRRNTESVKQALDDMNKRIYEQQILIENFRNTIGTLNSKIEELSTALNHMRARQSGTGPTSRG